MTDKMENWTVPGSIDHDAAKGTAAANPVLVLTEPGARGANARDTRSPAEIEAQLDLTRAHLTQTLDELAERLNPRTLARRCGENVKAQFVDLKSGKVRRGRAAAAAGVGGAAAAGVVGLLALRRRS
jgi:hypothetical protein